ncbi:NTF2-like protein [Cylindrobasidium torrendii FP15055 ss-10]|uniref:NTF2-like protein n=1 Tax=Cylindrobasidium torrendii FP15055 ss-10 TaxID=1314674 RepID=A0A0D7BEX5_9AGAR|nr:NTF2-like protein [Cylindrobasidium torrendii FP15055 ss-10]
MYSSPTRAPGSVAAKTLRKTGLMDKDTTMRDVSSGSRQGGRKVGRKLTSRPRPADAILGNSRTSLSTRPGPKTVSGATAIRGASSRMAVDIERRRAVARPSQSRNSVANWKEVVESRYDGQAQMLNLSNLVDDPIVKKYSLSPPGHGGTGTEAAVIFKLAQKLSPPPTKLDLSNNNLSPEHLSRLSHYLRDIQALSLVNNQLKTWRDLDNLSSTKSKNKGFSRLTELMLTGNPLQQSQANKIDNYKSEVTRRIPTVTLLDGQQIARIAFDVPTDTAGAQPVPAPSATTFPFEMLGTVMHGGISTELVGNFLMKYFELFDHNRPALIGAYNESCTFSVSANTNIPDRARIQGLQRKFPNQSKLSWGDWLDTPTGGSRNLTRTREWSKHDNRIRVGNQQVIEGISELPRTLHDLASSGNFVLDAMVVPHGNSPAMLLNIHGQFVEKPCDGLRSFDRTMILLPAEIANPGAKQAGWDLVILSDQLTVRAFSSSEVWKVGPMVVQPDAKRKEDAPAAAAIVPATSTPTPVLPPRMYAIPPHHQAELMQLPEAQQGLVAEFCQMTNLTPAVSVDCLGRTQGDVPMALAMVEAAKPSLGPQSFMQAQPQA